MNLCQWNFSFRNIVASKKVITELTPAIGYTFDAFACDNAVYNNAAAVAAKIDAIRTIFICDFKDDVVLFICRRSNIDTRASMRNDMVYIDTTRAIGSALPRNVLTTIAYAMSIGTSAAMINRERSKRGIFVMCSVSTR